MDLKGHGAIVTGGSRGLGEAIASTFLKAGAHVVICGRQTETLMAARRRILADYYWAAPLHAVVADVTNENDRERLIQTAKSSLPNLNILVNNAAILGPIGPSEQVDLAALVETFIVNAGAPLALCQRVIPTMREQQYGRIIQISGGGATFPSPLRMAYGASKVAVVRAMETLAAELKDTGITVNSVAPGAFSSSMTDALARHGLADADLIEPELATDLVLYLAASKDNTLTGRLLSAVWDDWPALAPNLPSDLYTLRRQV